ncbi:LysR family transcriptional regulator [Ramlibacter tataouinensis]|uniref:Transcriptional regulator, LysR family-like protein n=1 Tax=Ramlibacter tataouinensis (strain ATCC BAA-407 / DSM 14655 / LMG 21543 / TTB310) TaxID=365046 RepID=F5Y434_RAMTT|nr:LysR family transcriptional regulator [Ramlibacter tataouinensis]AEG92499.1 transcriptional regulator, LysR family-like protein [Ramlibacter tataouinensis TTB310]
MKIHLLRYFIVLAEELHFGRAAARLSITQPPLSSALKALEEELGVQLLERNSKQVALTAAGAAFLPEARGVLERVASAAETARSVAAGMRGRLDVGFTGSMIYRDMPRIVAGFNTRHPGIEVNLREMSTNEQVDALLHRQLHAGFLNAGILPTPLETLPLPNDSLVCCLPLTHRLASARSVDLRQLADETFVMFSRDVAPAYHDNVTAVFSQAGIHPRTRHAARQWLTVVALVAAGMGVAVVPETIGRAGIDGARLVRIRGMKASTTGVLAWNAQHRLAALDSFVNEAAARLRARAYRAS